MNMRILQHTLPCILRDTVMIFQCTLQDSLRLQSLLRDLRVYVERNNIFHWSVLNTYNRQPIWLLREKNLGFEKNFLTLKLRWGDRTYGDMSPMSPTLCSSAGGGGINFYRGGACPPNAPLGYRPSGVVDGEWDVSQERNMTFTLRDHEYINKLVESLVD